MHQDAVTGEWLLGDGWTHWRTERTWPFRRRSAQMAGIPVATLAQWRWRGVGPAYLKLGRHVRYDWADVEQWLAAQTRNAS
jgi:hypothetical protein